MIDINVRSTVDEVIADFDYIGEGIQSKAMVRGANTAATRVRTDAGREVRKIYNIKLKAVRAASSILRANFKSRVIRASVVFTGRKISLMEFAARPVNAWNVQGRKHTRRGGGVGVRIKHSSGRKVIKGAFITQTSRNNTPFVFQRVGRERYPIKNLRSVSIPTTITQRAVNAALVKIGHSKFRDEFVRQINLLIAKKT